MKILVFVCCVILGGYVIGEIVGIHDPALNNPFAGLNIEELNRDIQSLDVASGDAFDFVEEPSFEEMAVEEDEIVEVKTF